MPADREPFGSHPDLDPNWSTEILEFIHEADANKLEKCRLIGQYEVALQTLHVCLRYPETGLNCGECEKCLRSQVYLQVAGAAERCTAFPEPLNLKLLGQLKVSQDRERNLLYKALDSLEQQKTYPDTARVLRAILFRPSWQNRCCFIYGLCVRKLSSDSNSKIVNNGTLQSIRTMQLGIFVPVVSSRSDGSMQLFEWLADASFLQSGTDG